MKHKRLHRLATQSQTLNAFLAGVMNEIGRYGVPMWNKTHYQDFYEETNRRAE